MREWTQTNFAVHIPLCSQIKKSSFIYSMLQILKY
jgi:hypothetical protein